MYRSRSFRVLAILIGMAAILYFCVSLFLPSSRRLILGVDKDSGKVRLVQSHITYLPPHQFYRLSFEKREGAAQRDGLVQILSKERVPVTVSYRLRFSIPGGRLPDADSLVREGWSGWIRKRVAEAVSAVTQQVPIEELLSPTSEFTTRRDALRRIVSNHLARSGLQVTAFEIARMEPDRQALLEFKRAELRRAARGVAGRVAIFAIDGADWELVSELIHDGRLPNIAALARAGSTGSMQTIQPMVSPMVWTTLATGLPPDRHGVLDFTDRGANRPVDATTRRAPAIWDIAEAFGRRSAVVGWWTAWPPLRDGAASFDTPAVFMPDAIWPAELAPVARQLTVAEGTVQYPQVRRFLNITEREFRLAVEQGRPHDPVLVMRRILAKSWTDHRVAVELYQRQQPLLTMVSYDGADAVNHLFSPYHPPYREGIGQESFRRYWPAVANYHAEIDRLIGEWMKVLSEDTTVLIVSAHGFRWGNDRPRTAPAGRSALSDHRNPGVFIAYGNHVAQSGANHMVTLYDVVPSVLAILGLPASTEMRGRLPEWLLRGLTPVTSVRVVSYDEFFAGRPLRVSSPIDAQQYRARLQAIGHLLDPSRMQPVFEDQARAARNAAASSLPAAQWAPYALQNNRGIELHRQGRWREAAEAFQKAIRMNPGRPTPYLNFAMTLLQRQQYTAAENLFLMAVQHGLPDAERWFVDFAAFYRANDMTTRAVNLLLRGRQVLPQSYLIAANLGSALAQASRYSEGLPELERALSLQPSSTLVLNSLGTYYARRKDYARALDFWNRSLSIDPRQKQIREAAAAASTHL